MYSKFKLEKIKKLQKVNFLDYGVILRDREFNFYNSYAVIHSI